MKKKSIHRRTTFKCIIEFQAICSEHEKILQYKYETNMDLFMMMYNNFFFTTDTNTLASNRTPQTAPRAFFQLCINEQKFQSNLIYSQQLQYKGLGHDDKKITSCERGPNIKSVPDFCSKDYCCTTLEKTTILGSSLPMKLIKKSTRLFLFL